ncbi:hypothetical protein [uncultured Cohaesibacter sp.]|uniref:hypothetical protein n=1 Tax=uncultured Cohaesibacter sp. TaxID=1002546 RepID=UPI002AA6F8B7|nr:hypothetical protein [uncultured Cohaesibacter sp.]
MSTLKSTVAYGHQGHADFNKRFEPTAPANDIVNGPWLSNEALARLPAARYDFDRNRDPMIAAQLKEAERTKVERVEGQGDSGATSKRKDKPALDLKPPRTMRNQGRLEGMWLAAERDLAMSKHPKPSSRNEPSRDRIRVNGEPDLSP